MLTLVSDKVTCCMYTGFLCFDFFLVQKYIYLVVFPLNVLQRLFILQYLCAVHTYCYDFSNSNRQTELRKNVSSHNFWIIIHGS